MTFELRSSRPLLCVPLLLVAGTALAETPRISATELAASIRFLASDLLEGRAPGGRGDALARAYLASELEAAGLEPGGPDRSWEQRLSIVGLVSHPPETWRFAAPGGSVELAPGIDFVASSGVQRDAAEVTNGEVVFVGYGIQAPEFDWDDFKGVDLEGKVLLLLNDDPDWDDALFAGRRRLSYGRWDTKFATAARQGAAGAILVHTTPSAAYPWKVVQSSWSGEQFALPAGKGPELQFTAWTTEEASRRLVALGGHELVTLVAAARSRDFRPIPLGIRTSLHLEVDLRRVETANVAGLLRGSDPRLSERVVVLTSHHDHLGVGAPDVTGDRIRNGAIDNASGCAELLALARAFAQQPSRPARSLLFLFAAAEEQGLLGSKYFAEHPTLPIDRITATLNLDSANVYGPTRDIVSVGFGKSSDLDRVVEHAARARGRIVRGDPAPEKGSFYRSDQLPFAQLGIPALYLDPGTEFVGPGADAAAARQAAYDATCYHQPCDQIGDDWSYTGMIADTELVFDVVRKLADSSTEPRWNRGDEFDAQHDGSPAAVSDR